MAAASPLGGRGESGLGPVSVQRILVGGGLSRGSFNRSRKPGRGRVSQEDIDAMAELRREGLGFAEVGARRGFSERTARRFVGKVEPRLTLPQEDAEPETDPRALRERYVWDFLEILYRDRQLNALTMRLRKIGVELEIAEYGGPPSILFLSEAERLLRERLESIGVLALRLLARTKQLQARLLRETVGSLYSDYVAWHRFANQFGKTGEDWRPPRERPPVEPEEGEG